MRGDTVSGAALAGLGLYIIMAARGWNYSSPDGPGPGMFPLWYGVAMVALSLVLVVSSLMSRRENASAETPRVNWRETGNALLGWLSLALCIGLLKVLGFVLSFALLTLFIVAGIYRRPLRSALVTAALSSLGFYLLFPLALNVSLPVGVLGF